VPLRVAFDLDSVLADFGRVMAVVEKKLFTSPESESDNTEEDATAKKKGHRVSRRGPGPALSRRHQERVWEAIREIPDFWIKLQPRDPDAVRQIHEVSLQHRWDEFFVTQCPSTSLLHAWVRRSSKLMSAWSGKYGPASIYTPWNPLLLRSASLKVLSKLTEVILSRRRLGASGKPRYAFRPD